MTYQGQVGSDGESITVPAEVLRTLGLEPGHAFAFDVAGSSITIRPSPSDGDALTRLREIMRGYTLDQFLADRKRDGGE